jgi:hypothetical protein
MSYFRVNDLETWLRIRKWLVQSSNFQIINLQIICGQGWIRTTELRRGQIYSLLPLATWLLALFEIPNFQIPNPTSKMEFVICFFRISPEPLVGIEPTTY